MRHYFIQHKQVNFRLLKEIWDLSNTSKIKGGLNRPDFFRALRYIAAVQAGYKDLTEKIASLHKLQLPCFNGHDNNEYLGIPKVTRPTTLRMPALPSIVMPPLTGVKQLGASIQPVSAPKQMNAGVQNDSKDGNANESDKVSNSSGRRLSY